MNFTNIKVLIKELYNLRDTDDLYTNIKEQHLRIANATVLRVLLGEARFIDYYNRPEIGSVSITSFSDYSSYYDGYIKATTNVYHHLTNEQLVIINSIYPGLYKIKLIADSSTKTGWELDTFIFKEDFTQDGTADFTDKIKQDLDFCAAVFTMEKSIGYSRDPNDFDFTFRQYGEGNYKSSWEQVQARHLAFLKDVSKIITALDETDSDKTSIGFVECL